MGGPSSRQAFLSSSASVLKVHTDFTSYCSAFILMSEFMFINVSTFNIIISPFKYSNQGAAARTLSTLTHWRTHGGAQSRVANSSSSGLQHEAHGPLGLIPARS